MDRKGIAILVIVCSVLSMGIVLGFWKYTQSGPQRQDKARIKQLKDLRERQQLEIDLIKQSFELAVLKQKLAQAKQPKVPQAQPASPPMMMPVIPPKTESGGAKVPPSSNGSE